MRQSSAIPGLIFLLLALAATTPIPTSAKFSDSPSCALSGTPCPPPAWKPNWNLTMSTICQPGWTSGYFLPPVTEPWGLISLDWSVAMSLWRNPNANDDTCEATSIQGCQQIKQRFPETRCFIYHNMELALQALESQRPVMYDPTYAHWFLQYTDGEGNKNGTIYNEPADGPGDQYFWDFRLPEVGKYYLSSVLETLVDPSVDGTFTDDVTGFPAEHDSAPLNINMSADDVAQLQYATQLTNQQLIDALISGGKYNYQAFGQQDDVGPGVSRAECTSYMRARCNVAYQQQAVTIKFDSSNVIQSVASFLIVRPPIAFLGFGWESDMAQWNPIFLTQVGEPIGICEEQPSQSGVFTRQWTQGNATLDCNTWKATIPGVTLSTS